MDVTHWAHLSVKMAPFLLQQHLACAALPAVRQQAECICHFMHRATLHRRLLQLVAHGHDKSLLHMPHLDPTSLSLLFARVLLLRSRALYFLHTRRIPDAMCRRRCYWVKACLWT